MGEKWVKSRVLAALKDGCRLLGVIGAEPQSVGKNAHRLVWDYLFKWAPQCTNEKRGVDAGSKIIHNRGLCSKSRNLPHTELLWTLGSRRGWRVQD